MTPSARTLKWVLRCYPPLLGAGIWVRHISADFREVDVRMKQHWWNANYVGTHYGGSLFSMTDPFYMIMLLRNLGSQFIVWDRAATIRYLKPGRSTVHASFRLTAQMLDDLHEQLRHTDKIEPVFVAKVVDEEGVVIAEVHRTLYIRRKQPRPPA